MSRAVCNDVLEKYTDASMLTFKAKISFCLERFQFGRGYLYRTQVVDKRKFLYNITISRVHEQTRRVQAQVF